MGTQLRKGVAEKRFKGLLVRRRGDEKSLVAT
jgi:hypothetical protein